MKRWREREREREYTYPTPFFIFLSLTRRLGKRMHAYDTLDRTYYPTIHFCLTLVFPSLMTGKPFHSEGIFFSSLSQVILFFFLSRKHPFYSFPASWTHRGGLLRRQDS
ncbi:hypothetical protein T440DRAFT_249066 [Plenodomus tracheiphilus IPT5]|uniref:Uncharacterized protein n=1 Tax=Plenodomus tracheiphilus IPT5 TaxID=1408161 RepID=A0A6A7AS55_9PLEO|nr:hypothetical protein T440DRAFT_249066 [Plenodomus tracheiphilus IPT5]